MSSLGATPGPEDSSRGAALRAVLRAELRARARARGSERLLRSILALIAAAIAFLGCFLRSALPTPEEQESARFGAAQLRIDGLTRAEAERLLAPHADELQGEWWWSGPLLLERGADRRPVLGVVPPVGPLGRGIVSRTTVSAGPAGSLPLGDDGAGNLAAATLPADRAGSGPRIDPLAPDALRVSSALQSWLSPGDLRDVAVSGSAGEFRRVLGRVEFPEDLSLAVLEWSPTRLPEGAHGSLLVAEFEAQTPASAPNAGPAGADSPAVQVGSSLPALARLMLSAERRGHRVHLRPRTAEPDRFLEVLVLVLGGFALALASLVIAAALTVSLARREREFGLLRASGANERLVNAACVGATAIEAALFGAAGSALGAFTAALTSPWFDTWTRRHTGPFEWSPVHVFGGPLLCIAAATLAALWPVRGLLRRSVLENLGAQRPDRSPGPGGVPLAVLTGGLSLLALWLGRTRGAELPLLLLVGPLFGLVALCLATAPLLGLAGRWAGRGPLALRLALREASRFRTRDGALAAAILCASAAAVAVLLLQESVAGAIATRPGASLSGLEQVWISRVTLLLAWLLGAGIASLAGALAHSETQHDRRILEALGAPARIQRWAQALRLFALALLGSLLALPAGTLPLLGVLPLASIEIELALPWPLLAGLVLGTPLIVALGAAALWRPAGLRDG